MVHSDLILTLARHSMHARFRVEDWTRLMVDNRPHQLILMDDPAFAIENALMPPPDWLNDALELAPLNDSQRSSQSMLSIRDRSRSTSSHVSILGLDLGSSSQGGGSYQLPRNDPFGGSSAIKDGLFGDDEELGIMNEEEFEFDDNGNLVEITAGERAARPLSTGNVFQGGLGRSESGSAFRKEVEDPFVHPSPRIIQDDEDFEMIGMNNQVLLEDQDLPILPAGEPFPAMAGGLGGSDRLLHLDEHLVGDLSRLSEEPSSDEVQANQMHRKQRQKKNIAVDRRLAFTKGELKRWQQEYLQIMAAATLANNNRMARRNAKKMAFQYVYGTGINGVGKGIGAIKLDSPLDVFSGEHLLAKFIGEPTSSVAIRGKRTHSIMSDDDDETPSKRVRESEVGKGDEFEDGMPMSMGDEDRQSRENSVEMGRDAPDALPEHPSSALMPWNISASLNSHQRAQSSSMGGRPSKFGSQIGSLTGRGRVSASPLVGRGSNILGDLSQFSQQIDNEMVMYGRSDNFDSPLGAAGVSSGSSQGGGGSPNEEFEIFGAAAQVDTQTAGTSQWVRDALHRESENFLEYLQNSIEEKFGDELGDEQDFDVEGREEKSVGFEELFEPGKNTCIVAAQAFYHVLCLATKRRIWVEQGAHDFEPFGEIKIGVVG